MSKKRLIALGYPLGFALNNDKEVYNILLNDLTYSVRILPSYVWIAALEEMSTREELLNRMNFKLQELELEDEEIDLETLNPVVDNLIELGLLMEFEESEIENFLDSYGNLKVFRTGFGVGIEDAEGTISVDGENISVNPIEYLAWQLGSGTMTLKDSAWEYYKIMCMVLEDRIGTVDKIDTKAYKEMVATYVVAVLSLYNKGLIYITAS